MASIIYRAPEGDSEVVETFGYKFFNGLAVEVSEPEIVSKFKGNRFFDVADVEITAVEVSPEPVKRGPGRPPKVVIEAPVEAPAEKEAGE